MFSKREDIPTELDPVSLLLTLPIGDVSALLNRKQLLSSPYSIWQGPLSLEITFKGGCEAAMEQSGQGTRLPAAQ